MLYDPGENGQGLTEYALIIVLIAVLLMVALGLVGTSLNDLFSRIASSIIG